MTVQATIDKLRAATTPISSYDSAKVNIGSLIVQNTGGADTDKWCGPTPIGAAHPQEETTVFTPGNCSAINWSSTKDWFFYIQTTAATTLKVGMYEINRVTGAFAWKGFVTLTPPPATNHSPDGFKALLHTYSTGTVAVSGTAVTGTSTAWQTARFAVGARIGFGSTDPTQIVTWYNITAITNDTSITINSSAGSIGAGSAFVIEEIRLVMANTNNTATNGGLFLAKGLNYSTFVSGGTTIPAGVSTDNIQAVYWLADASTVTNTSASGLGVGTFDSNTQQYAYVQDGSSTTAKIYKYNLRAALSLSSGKDTANAIQLVTGGQTVTGNVKSTNSLVFANMASGAGSGVPCLYLVTSGPKIYRIPISSIIAASTSFIADSMTTNFPANLSTAAFLTTSIDYDSTIDRLIMGNAGDMYMVTPYDTSGNTIDFPAGVTDLQSVAISAPAGVSNRVRMTGNHLVACAAGMLYTLSISATTNLAALNNLPLAAHWKYASVTGQRLITPSIATSGASNFYRAYVNDVVLIAATPDSEVSWNAEPYRMYARTAGISDNSGAWTLLNDTGDLSSFAGANAIQLMFEFRTFSKQCLPARILNVCVVWESSAYIPGWLEWNVNDDDLTNGTVGFTEITTNGSVPNFQIDYYREDTNANVLTQQSTGTTNGVFEQWNGSLWVAGTGSDTVGQRRRFRPTAGLPSGVNLYQKLSTF